MAGKRISKLNLSFLKSAGSYTEREENLTTDEERENSDNPCRWTGSWEELK